MRPSYLLATALMLATTANSWAQDATDGVPNIKQPDQENIQTQMRDTWETIKQFSADQKDQALAALRHAMDALDEDIDQASERIDENWQDMSQDARLKKQEALSELKEQRETLQTRYQQLEASSGDNWEAAKARFGGAWESTKDAWSKLTAPDPEQDRN
ncbi:hypothetical protein ACLD02_00615 [Alloalcanivorax sp. C16-2]|uniref:hypothetical protein n=1 Tax=Alloalcanivorax sp. C16-2 TaxID=3390052 RepID=UPI003970962D